MISAVRGYPATLVTNEKVCLLLGRGDGSCTLSLVVVPEFCRPEEVAFFLWYLPSCHDTKKNNIQCSDEKVNTLRAFGADVVVTPGGLPADHPDHYGNKARTIAEEMPVGHLSSLQMQFYVS